MAELPRVLWLYGPPGAGKSSVAWALLNLLAAGGDRVAHLDLDQLGMLWPPPAGDPDGERLKGRALGRVARVHARAGAATLVVSGTVDLRLLPVYAAWLAPLHVVFVRLRADEAELGRRVSARGAWAADQAEVLKASRELDGAAPPHPVVSTDGRTPDDTAREVLEVTSGAPPQRPAADLGPEAPAPAPSVRALLIGGAPAVGKSTVAWEVATLVRRSGLVTGFVDLRQLGFLGRDGGDVDHALQAAACGALSECFRDAGAQLLVLNGPVQSSDELDLYAEQLAGADLHACRLVADERSLTERVGLRVQGHGPALAGDRLRGASPAVARQAVEAALRAQSRHPDDGSRFPGLDTSGLSASQAAHAVLARTMPELVPGHR